MELTNHSYSYQIAKNSLVFAALFIFVLASNYTAITYGMIYYEQAPLYLANQQITSFIDLISVYLHPQMLYSGAIPFFRPSGHFLLYQLLTPILGWHNIKGFIIVNLFFLALCGLLFIKIYALLFPKFKTGGYIAFGIYVMQPTLILPRLMVVQFEFSYIFFCLLSLYCFILFCQKNISFNQRLLKSQLFLPLTLSTIVFRYYYLFTLSLLFYITAVTFKEISIVLIIPIIYYLFISFHEKQPWLQYCSQFFQNPALQKMIAILTLTVITLVVYICIQELHGKFFHGTPAFIILVQYLQYLFGLWQSPINSLWTHTAIIFPISAKLMLWFFTLCLLFGIPLLFSSEHTTFISSYYKKSLLFLLSLAITFLLLPIYYVGWPWHISMTIAALALLMGFCFDYLFATLIKNKPSCLFFSTILVLLMGYINSLVIHTHIDNPYSRTNFSLLLNHNAVFNPPNIKHLLTSDSVLIVQDTMHLGAYSLGDSQYLMTDLKNYNEYRNYFLKVQPIYNGTLFRWAYLMPNLNEEIYPYNLNTMKYVTDELIHHWAQHYNNIFSVGYDQQGIWHDLTAAFKHQLFLEQKRRHLVANAYQSNPNHFLVGRSISTLHISTPHSLTCEMLCDQNKKCRGFNFMYSADAKNAQASCNFISTATPTLLSYGINSTSYTKKESL